MSKSILPLILTVMVASATASNARSATCCYWNYAPMHYETVGTEFSLIRFDFDASLAWLGHNGQHLSDCSDDRYFCFRSAGYRFSVPRRDIDQAERWNFDDETYTNLGTATLNLAGQVHSVRQIERETEGSSPQRFLYSTKRGLLAIIDRDDELGSSLYISDSKFGFGAGGKSFRSKTQACSGK